MRFRITQGLNRSSSTKEQVRLNSYRYIRCMLDLIAPVLTLSSTILVFMITKSLRWSNEFSQTCVFCMIHYKSLAKVKLKCYNMKTQDQAWRWWLEDLDNLTCLLERIYNLCLKYILRSCNKLCLLRPQIGLRNYVSKVTSKIQMHSPQKDSNKLRKFI